MTKYLLECGHRKIAFLADNMEGVDYVRYTGHQRALQEYNIDVDLDNLIVIRPSKYERQGKYGRDLRCRTQISTAFYVLLRLLCSHIDEISPRKGTFVFRKTSLSRDSMTICMHR